jgi:hypothetical protein
VSLFVERVDFTDLLFRDLLSHYKAAGESFLSQIITGDETQTHHFELQTINQWNGIIKLFLRVS